MDRPERMKPVVVLNPSLGFFTRPRSGIRTERMGYETVFYGKLRFTRRYGEEELARVRRILEEPRLIGKETCSAYLDARLKNNWDNDRDNRLMGEAVLAAVKAAGFEVTNGNGYRAHDLRITRDGMGLEYCSEKSYDLIDSVNFIIENGRKFIPGFKLSGSLFASTEFEPYHWLLKIGSDGFAHQEPCRMIDLLPHSPKAYLQHLRLNWDKPSHW